MSWTTWSSNVFHARGIDTRLPKKHKKVHVKNEEMSRIKRTDEHTMRANIHQNHTQEVVTGDLMMGSCGMYLDLTKHNKKQNKTVIIN